MPDYGTVQNPLDVTGAAIIDPSLFTRSIEAIAADESIGVVGVINSLPWTGSGPYFGQKFVDAIGAGMRAAACPSAYISQVMLPITDYSRESMALGGVPYAIPGLRQAIVALRGVAWWSEVTRDLSTPAAPQESEKTPPLPVPPPALRRGQWSEHAARELLVGAGIPVIPARLVTSAADAVAAARAIAAASGSADPAMPLCLKIVSPQILHKTEIGGVRLDVPPDPDAIKEAYRAVTAAAQNHAAGASVEGVLVSPMRRGGTELLVGVARDPQWGLMLAVALGGVFVEVMQDSALAPLPVTPTQARSMLGRLRGAAALAGARGTEPADLDALAAVIARLGDLAAALGDDLESLEVNPFLVNGPSIEALDAVVTWTRPD